jgi:hypothetical protein
MLSMEFWSDRFLGTDDKCLQFIEILESIDGGRWHPERWNECEPIRKPYTAESVEKIRSVWTDVRGGNITNYIAFKRSKPRFEAWVEVWRARRPWLNSARLKFDFKPFSGIDGVERIKEVFFRLVDWSEPVYAWAHHSDQRHRRFAQGTALDRLEHLDWLTYFGPPYIESFGGLPRVLAAPAYEVRERSGGVYLHACLRPDAQELTESNELLCKLENHLGRDFFIAGDFSEIPCRLPQFDLRDLTRPETDEGQADSKVNAAETLHVIRNRRGKPIAAVMLTPPHLVDPS